MHFSVGEGDGSEGTDFHVCTCPIGHKRPVNPSGWGGGACAKFHPLGKELCAWNSLEDYSLFTSIDSLTLGIHNNTWGFQCAGLHSPLTCSVDLHLHTHESSLGLERGSPGPLTLASHLLFPLRPSGMWTLNADRKNATFMEEGRSAAIECWSARHLCRTQRFERRHTCSVVPARKEPSFWHRQKGLWDTENSTLPVVRWQVVWHLGKWR